MWRFVAVAALALSVNSVVGLHAIGAAIGVAVTGWSLTAGGSEWWLIPAGAIGAWTFVRLVREISECRGALVMMMGAAASYAAAGAASVGWSPAWLGAWSGALTVVGPLLGHTLALAGMMLFARYVVLDVQGLIEHKPRPRAKAPAKRKAEKTAAPAIAATIAPATAPAARRQQETTPAARRRRR